MKRVIKRPLKRTSIRKKRVAAYARVSTNYSGQENSIANQISYYNDFIQQNPQWIFAGVFYDDGVSGSSIKERTGFQDMLSAARNGNIDIILTKSISRFARNTVDLLNTVRQLKDMGVEVKFEKENISTFGMDGEFLLTILASYAEAEVQSVRENVRWGIRKKFQQGIPHGGNQIYGYRWEDGNYQIVPDEAEVVKLIFANYLNGISAEKTARQLAIQGIKGFHGGDFDEASIRGMLSNVTYTGNLLLQKKFVADDVERRKVCNNGELPQYYVTGSHEAIISKETFDEVQKRIMARREELFFRAPEIPIYRYTQKIRCSICGSYYVRSDSWCCGKKKREGVAACNSINLNEKMLDRLIPDNFICITVNGYQLTTELDDGNTVTIEYRSTVRQDYWGDEANRKRHRKGLSTRKNCSKYTGLLHCSSCGLYFCHRIAKEKHLDYWRCKGARKNKECHAWNIKNEVLEKVIPETVGIDYIDVSGGKLRLVFEDGRIEDRWLE